MDINEKDFPILSCVYDNQLGDRISEFVYTQVHDEAGIKEIMGSAAFFKHRHLNINYITNDLHNKLQTTSDFLPYKHLLKASVTGAGLLLLPEILYPDFSNVPDFAGADPEDYPIDAILYSWLSINDHEKHSGSFDTDMPWENDDDRELFILPIYQDGTTQATGRFEMTNNDEIYGWEYSTAEGRGWYGKVHDYVMSFILCLIANTEQPHTSADKPKVVLNSESYLNNNSNLISVLSIADQSL